MLEGPSEGGGPAVGVGMGLLGGGRSTVTLGWLSGRRRVQGGVHPVLMASVFSGALGTWRQDQEEAREPRGFRERRGCRGAHACLAVAAHQQLCWRVQSLGSLCVGARGQAVIAETTWGPRECWSGEEGVRGRERDRGETY